MQLKEYLAFNGVKLMAPGWDCAMKEFTREKAQEVHSLSGFKFVIGLENVVGKHVWICDYRNGDNVFGKPIRAIEPTLVEVCDAKKAKKNIYYSPIYFRAVKADGTLKAAEISPIDNTGFRGCAGESVEIEDAEDADAEEVCRGYYKLKLEQTLRVRKIVLAEYQANIDALEAKIKALP